LNDTLSVFLLRKVNSRNKEAGLQLHALHIYRGQEMKTWILSLTGILVVSFACISYSLDVESVPTATPAPPPLQPTFSSISENIFSQKCVICHGPGGSAASMPVTDYNFLIKMKWVVPSNLAQSSLYVSVKSNRMPPGPPLSQTEINTIGNWITAGAKNN
jgi:hypothetical protein